VAATLNRVLGLGPEHLSCYALSLEHGTPMRAWVYRGLLPMPDPDLAAEMYDWASETLEANGYEQYEISNWARASRPTDHRSRPTDRLSARSLSLRRLTFSCRHNLQYWRNLPYLGFGAGAHGCAGGWRYSNVLAPAAFSARLEGGGSAGFPFSPAVVEKLPVTPEAAMCETMMLGLRLTREGVREADFRARFGVGIAETYARPLRRLAQLGLIEHDDGGVRLTRPGRLLGNRVFREFV
jgi:oxygen-independent coproporphyrinogen-3 oxidase